jgi:hypothetical protein
MTQRDRRPANTMHERCQANIDEEYSAKGRWAKHDRPVIVGTTPQWQAPAIGGAGPWATTDIVPPEPPTGERVDWIPSMETVSGIDRAEALAIDAANAAPATNPEDDAL